MDQTEAFIVTIAQEVEQLSVSQVRKMLEPVFSAGVTRVSGM